MSEIPGHLRYTKNHEWVRPETDGSVTVGITDHAQELLGDLVYIELPVLGKQVAGGAEVAVVESVKAAADVYAPLAGVVTEVNQAVAEAPETVNQTPYDAWLFRMLPKDVSELDALADAEAYRQMLSD